MRFFAFERGENSANYCILTFENHIEKLPKSFLKKYQKNGIFTKKYTYPFYFDFGAIWWYGIVEKDIRINFWLKNF